MTPCETVIFRRLYDLEREAPGRNFAKDHSFQEWLERQG
jgi:hypothetical protein